MITFLPLWKGSNEVSKCQGLNLSCKIVLQVTLQMKTVSLYI